MSSQDIQVQKDTNENVDGARTLIFQGANLSQLGALFGMDKQTIIGKLKKSDVKPVGRRRNADVYLVKDVAPHIIKPAFDVETYIKQMHHSELPKHLTKEFWAGLKSRQDYEEREGLLWRTEKVVEEVGDLFKLVKMSALLMMDAVERTTELSDRQRELIKNLTHGMLDEIVQRIEQKFQVPQVESKPETLNERQKAEDLEEL